MRVHSPGPSRSSAPPRCYPLTFRPAGPTRFARPLSLLLCAVALLTVSVPALLQARPAAPPDYPALYNNGITFADFLEFARAKRDEWRQRYKDASVTPDLITRMRAL